MSVIENGSVVISIKEYDELREIRDNNGKIQVVFKRGDKPAFIGLMGWLPRIGSSEWDGEKIYIGHDHAFNVLSVEAEARIKAAEEEKNLAETERDIILNAEYNLRQRIKILFTGKLPK